MLAVTCFKLLTITSEENKPKLIVTQNIKKKNKKTSHSRVAVIINMV